MKLLVGVDLAESTEKVVKKAEEMAKAFSAEVLLLHVAEPEPDFVGFDVGPQSVRGNLAELFHLEHSRIHEIALGLREVGLNASALLIQGTTAEAILKTAGRHGVDIIILGLYRRSAMYQMVMGSVCDEILHHSECPVLVVPMHEHIGVSHQIS